VQLGKRLKLRSHLRGPQHSGLERVTGFQAKDSGRNRDQCPESSDTDRCRIREPAPCPSMNLASRIISDAPSYLWLAVEPPYSAIANDNSSIWLLKEGSQQ
jgi:hypothetical protein